MGSNDVVEQLFSPDNVDYDRPLTPPPPPVFTYPKRVTEDDIRNRVHKVITWTSNTVGMILSFPLEAAIVRLSTHVCFLLQQTILFKDLKIAKQISFCVI